MIIKPQRTKFFRFIKHIVKSLYGSERIIHMKHMEQINVTGNFADRLGDLIEESGKTLDTIAAEAGIKSKSTLSKYSNNGAEAGINNLVILAKYFNVSTDYLLGLTNYPYTLTSDKNATKRATTDYIGLSADCVEKLHTMKIDFTLTPVLEFLLQNGELLQSLCDCFYSEESDFKLSPLLKEKFQEKLNKNPKLKDKIKLINKLKGADIRTMADYAYCPVAANSLPELIRRTEEINRETEVTDCINCDDEEETGLINYDDIMDSVNYDDCREFINEAYKYEIGRKIIDKALSGSNK